jgi:hypothetical protein
MCIRLYSQKEKNVIQNNECSACVVQPPVRGEKPAPFGSRLVGGELARRRHPLARSLAQPELACAFGERSWSGAYVRCTYSTYALRWSHFRSTPLLFCAPIEVDAFASGFMKLKSRDAFCWLETRLRPNGRVHPSARFFRQSSAVKRRFFGLRSARVTSSWSFYGPFDYMFVRCPPYRLCSALCDGAYAALEKAYSNARTLDGVNS